MKLFQRSEFYLVVLIALICIFITSQNPNFLTLQNLYGVLRSASVNGIFAVGVLFVLILGGTPDVSFPAIAQVTQYVAVLALIAIGGGNIALAFAIAIVLGAVMGALNGIIIQIFRVTTIVVTIATFNLYFGMLYVLSRGDVLFEVPRPFHDFGGTLLFAREGANGAVYGLSLLPVLWLAVMIVGWFILRRTMLGRSIFAMGGDEVSAVRIGVNTFAVRLFVFSFVGALAGIAGIAHASLVLSAIPNSIVGVELEVIAAVVLGGASLFGGKGTVTGTMLGVLLFAILRNGLVLLNISSYWYDVTIGIAIILGMSANAWQQLRARRNQVNVAVEGEAP
ncbi:MAG: ABC transporter permease [Rhodobacteraceae bacterium]|jgi:simple sugar transport system permease protein|nr:ABC transporter permease [Paracoccaceae bacterium]